MDSVAMVFALSGTLCVSSPLLVSAFLGSWSVLEWRMIQIGTVCFAAAAAAVAIGGLT